MHAIFLALIFGCFWKTGYPKHIPSFAGPYQVIGRRIWNESEIFHPSGDLFMVIARFTWPRPRHKQYIWGSVHMSHPLEDDVKVEVRMSQWANNQWKRNAFIFRFENACSAMFVHAKFLAHMILEKHEMECPIRPIGNRELKNQSFEPVFPHFPVFPYGRYLFEMAFKKNEKTAVLVGDFEVVPKI